jgi:molybdenum cofactor cytidylyltransferase
LKWISGVLLAAGESTRMGRPKQLLPFEGEPLVRRVARQALASRLAELIVVVGHAADAVRQALTDLNVRIVENPRYPLGQSTSVIRGLEAVDPRADAALFLVADQPFLDAALIDRLIAAYEKTGGPIVLPVFQGRRGSPVLFDRSLFDELRQITGDEGGRQLLQRYPERIVCVELESDRPLFDVDTPEAYRRLLSE